MKKLILLKILLLGLLTVPAAAQTQWTGGGGDNLWSTGANWSTDPAFPTSGAVSINNSEPLTVLYDIAAGTTFTNLHVSDASNSRSAMHMPSTLAPGDTITAHQLVLAFDNGGHSII